MTRRLADRWMLSRSDAAAGALASTRLVHPLLPEITRCRAEPAGFLLAPVPAPAPLAVAPGEAGPFLVRFLGLLSFLHAQGLGVSARDLACLGARAGRPILGAPPVPAWRALPPQLAAAVVAARLAGERFSEASADELRAALERAALSGALREAVHAALRAESAGRSPEVLVHAWWEELAKDAPLGPDLLGFVLPRVPRPTDGRIAAAWGPEALFVARACARRGEEDFAESGAGAVLQEGAALALLADAIDSDPRAPALAAAARGEKLRVLAGPPLALVARDRERWDRRSREAWEKIEEIARVEVLAAPPAPWERRELLRLEVGLSEAAALVWLPFASLLEAVAFWERLARAAGGEPARLIALARQAAKAMRPGAPLPRPTVRRDAGRAPSPLLLAAACLAPDFDAAEAALAGGGTPEEAAEVIADALSSGDLVAAAPGLFRFADEERRAALVKRLGAPARRALAARLDRLPGERRAAAALARGAAEDVRAAGRLLREAVRADRQSLALALLARAPENAPQLGEPLHALLALARTGRREEAERAAARGISGDGEPLAPRAEAARALVRLGRVEDALALVPLASEPEALLARARVLLEARRAEEAARLLDAIPPPLEGAPRVDALLLSAEIAERRGAYDACARALRRAGHLLAALPAGALHAEAVRAAGFLASDLRKTDEALAFFRRARDEARSPEGRADAEADLAVAAYHGERFEEAARHTDAALAGYAALRDRERYVSILGNRADLDVALGDASAARRDLEPVLAQDRAKGREHQLLFALSTLQRLCLADGDLEGASRAFAEAESLRQPASHGAWREALVLEARRLLMEREPKRAAARLDEAAALADNRMRSEPLRARLAASAALDAGANPRGDGLAGSERRLLDVERALRGGQAPPRAALDELQRAPGGSFLVAERLVEWALRFPEALARQPALLSPGASCARRAGLAGAEALLSSVAAPPAPASPAASSAAQVGEEAVAEDASMRALLSVADRIAPTKITILILGETGTGKEVLARRLHGVSKRRGPFVAVNVAALTPTLVESELFGHAKGAFTGAERDKQGLVEASSGGTLFLDEIGDLPLPLQAKLLRVLQERELVRVGETKPRKVDLRVLAATHRPLAEMAKSGAFRFDLYQRLAGVTLEIPPLRERPRDLSALAARALGGARITPDARRLLFSHAWPGNVRELLSAIEAARALAAGDPIAPEHLPAALRRDAPPAAASYRDAVEAARRRIIQEALDVCGGNRTHAAKKLGLSRQSLLYEIKKLGL